MDWDVDRFADTVPSGKFQSDKDIQKYICQLQQRFGIGDLGSFDEPLTVVDKHGRIFVWYLPILMTKWRLVILLT